MTSKGETHGGKQLVCKIGVASGAKSLIKRGGEDWSRNTLVNGSLDRPPAFSRVGDSPSKLSHGRALHKRRCCKAEELGGDDAAASPDFSNISQIELILVKFGVT
jgi:hypothetical protein